MMFTSAHLDGIMATLPLLLSLPGVQGQNSSMPTYNTSTLTGFAPCDALLSANLSHAVHLPASPLYPTLVTHSWSSDTQRAPWCFVVPSTTAEVSQILVALRTAGNGAGDWHVAIRSGGHGSDHQNSLTDGVIIDLSQLNSTTYDASTKVASVGTGAKWGPVYSELAKSGVSVNGGREGVVGVGGLLLGAGISWYTARNGFACDSITNFEVVLSSGQIINANASAHADLYRALKGGSSNFGLVTRFDVETFPAMNLVVNTRTINMDHSDELTNAIAEFTNLDQTFHDNAMIAVMTYTPGAGIRMNITEINTANDPNSTAFKALNQIPTQGNTITRSVTLAQSANNTVLPKNQRNVGVGSTMIANDPRVMRHAIEEHARLVDDLTTRLGAQNFSTIFDFQPFPAYFAELGVQKGGNMLGLERNARNRILSVSGVSLLTEESQKQYPQIYQRLSAMKQSIIAYAKSVGSGEDFAYLPYADASQDPLGSYGSANLAYMRRVASSYDPYAFFQRRVPGGFKLDRAN